MKILYSPEFAGHVFLGLNEENTHLMDAFACDTMGLVGMLELRLGIHVENHPTHYRTVKYFRAMSEYMRQHPDNALAASFRLSSLGTAEQALRWRDSLILDKWQPEAETNGSGRLDVLAGTEVFFDCPGMPDRLKTVLSFINKEKKDLFSDLEIELPCALSLLHPAVVELLKTLQKYGTTISVRQWDKSDSICNRFLGDSISVNGKTIYTDDLGGRILENGNKGIPVEAPKGKNLLHISHLLQSCSDAKVKLDKDDRSFLIYRFHDEKAANEYLALKGEDLKADVWINNTSKSMDNWLRMMGKPTIGSNMTQASPQLLQLFVLGIDMMKEPLNIQSLISWLYAPMQPLGTFFGCILAETVIETGGYRNEKCEKVVKDYISGKYTFHDKEEEEKLSETEIAKRNKKEEKERQHLVDTYLPTFILPQDSRIDATKLKVYLNSLSAWARSRSHYLRPIPGNEGWCSQLESLAQMCDTFVLLIDSSDMDQNADIRQMESWISTLFKGESFMQYGAQKGSFELIDSPAKMAAHSNRTVWMNFAGGETAHLDCSFLYPSEKEGIKTALTLWEERRELDYHQTMQQLPFFLTDEQLILVVTDYSGGEVTQKHPVMVRLESQIANLDDFIVTPDLLDEETEDVRLVRNNNIEPLITFDHADLLRWPGNLSPTSISTLVEYPLDFMMERMLNIVSTGPSSIKDVKTTKGNVAHAVIESLFAPRDGKPCSRADDIEKRIGEEFDEQVRKQIESCGAILYLPENRLDAELLREQLRRCLDVLLEIIRDNHLTVTGCEHLVTKDMGLLPNDKGWDMKGYIDMTLEDENHHPVVFDFKWTSSKSYYRDLLAANRSVQLELYRNMFGAEKRDAVERTAYFLMPEAHLYSKNRFEGLHCTRIPPENNDNIVEQLRQSFFYRKKQMDCGTVEVGEAFPVDMLDYYKDTEGNNLFPLATDGTGAQKANIFSNYGLFKV